MRRIAIDTETHLIQPGMVFPRGVCLSWFESGMETAGLVSFEDGLPLLEEWLRDPNVLLVGHNVAYDLGVVAAEAFDRLGRVRGQEILRLIFAAYGADRVTDTMIRAMLISIAEGTFQEIEGARRGREFSLAAVAKKRLGIELAKEDTYRLHYASLDGVPIAQWPSEAQEYARLDAEVTATLDASFLAQLRDEGISSGVVPDEFRQARGAWALHLIGGWGVRIDPTLVTLIKQALLQKRDACYTVLDEWGVFKRHKKTGAYALTGNGARQKNMTLLRKYIAEGFEALGEEPPLTEGGASGTKRLVSTSEEAARASGHPAAVALADISATDKLLSTYIPVLERGTQGVPVTCSYNVLVASGRTSCGNPNWQNPPKVGSVRECVVPRPGNVFVGADLDTVELRALAQTCLEMFGHSEMAVALQRGEDLHLSLAATGLGRDYGEVSARYKAGDPDLEVARTTYKGVNFGLGGGMGAARFAKQALDGGTPLIRDPAAPWTEHVAEAARLKQVWFKRWPEMRLYLRHAGEQTGDLGAGRVVQPWSGRVRGGLSYSAYANTLFQGRVADGAKLALWRLTYACYVDESSPLFGARIVLFLHDEVIVECAEARIDEVGDELVKILCAAVQEVIPDVPITSTAVAMRRWRKGAKPVRVGGKLVPGIGVKDPITGAVRWEYDPGDHSKLTATAKDPQTA